MRKPVNSAQHRVKPTDRALERLARAGLIQGSHSVREVEPSVDLPSVFRKPVRVTITLPHNIYQHLKRRSDEEGRSLSNLAAFLLEKSLL